MTNLESVVKSRNITLLTKVHIVKAMVFPEVMYGYESWAIKIECQRTDAFKLCWRRLLRVPWTARRLVQFSSVSQSYLTLWDPMDCPVHHQLLELAQTHVHWVGDDIQPSHPLSSPSPPAFNLSQHQGLSDESVLHIRWPEDWSFSFSISPSNEYSELISFRMNWLDLLAVQGDSQKSSPTPELKSINSSVFSFLYGTTLTSIHDYWKNHSSKVMCLLFKMLSAFLMAFFQGAGVF